MSQYDQIAPEPRKLFLAQLLNDDQIAGEYMCRGEYSQCVYRMQWILMKIRKLVEKKEVTDLLDKMNRWKTKTSYSPSDVEKARQELSDILSEHFYSEMNLGIVQTSSLEGTKATPEHKAVREDLSSKLG